MIREWFSLDGIRCDDLGIAMLGYTAQLLPEQRTEVADVPGMQGEYVYFSGAFHTRQFVIQCALLSDDAVDLAEKTKAVKGWISGNRKLEIWDRAGIAYEARLSNVPAIDNQILWGEFELTFTCKPYGVGVVRVVPFDAPGIVFGNGGNIETPCVITATLAEDADGITIKHAKGLVRIIGALTAGQALAIDGEKRYVTLNGVGIMPRVDIHIDWPAALPGANTITVSAAASCSVAFSERWI